jgi:peptide/nickel transport system ATP-binding protein/oligopeptide transport system ATP-binding protein
MTEALLDVVDLVKEFPARDGGVVHAVDGVSFALARGETLALVGESGCGKSTVARLLVRLLEPTAGAIRVDGGDIAHASRRELRTLRHRVQIVFQDPYAALDPRLTVRAAVAEPLQIAGRRGDVAQRVPELFELVGLGAEHAARYPHELSGGQRQRVGIARALALDPEVLVLDEPVSALDVSIQAQILNLLRRLQRELGLTYLFISHDLAAVRYISERIMVMYLGRIAEAAPSKVLYRRPLHPYTIALLSAAPVPDPKIEEHRRRIILTGDMPSPANPPPGCRFSTRCWLRQQLGWIVRVVMTVWWVSLTLELFQLRGSVVTAATNFLTAQWSIGSVALSIGGVLRFGAPWRGRRRIGIRPRPSFRVYDPETGEGPTPGDTSHINNVYSDGASIYCSGVNMGTLWRIADGRLNRFAKIPYGTHNARPFREGVLMNHTATDRIAYVDRNGEPLKSYPIVQYPREQLKHAELTTDKARQAFGRGLAVLSDESFVGGSSPATVTLYRFDLPEIVASVNITMDIRNAVHGLEIWPY